MKKIQLLLFDYEPKPKQRPRMARGGFAYTPKKTKDAEADIVTEYRKTYEEQQFPAGVPLKLNCQFGLKIPSSMSKKKRDALHNTYCMKHIDIDNLVKLVQDALNGIAYADDCQIVEITAGKRWSKYPYVMIELTDISL